MAQLFLAIRNLQKRRYTTENYVVCYESNEWGYFGKNVAFVSQKL